MHYPLRDNNNALALATLEKVIKKRLSWIPLSVQIPMNSQRGLLWSKTRPRSELRGNSFGCFCVIQLTHQPTSKRHGRKKHNLHGGKNCAQFCTRTFNVFEDTSCTAALHNTAFIYIGISVIVISFQYFPVPMPLLTPLSPHICLHL